MTGSTRDNPRCNLPSSCRVSLAGEPSPCRSRGTGDTLADTLRVGSRPTPLGWSGEGAALRLAATSKSTLRDRPRPAAGLHNTVGDAQ